MTTNNPKQPVTPIEEFEELCRSAIKQGLICPHPETFWNYHTSQMKKFAEEITKLSDDIENEHTTTMEEWKAFKHFRNSLRDYLKKWGLEGER